MDSPAGEWNQNLPGKSNRMFFSKQKSILGVDIGTSYIKIAQVTHGKQATLDTYGIVNIGEHLDSYKDDAVLSHTAQVLKTLVEKAHVTATTCIVSLPNAAVFTSVIDMPTMSELELDSAMKYEAKKYVPLPFSDVALSWSVLSKAADGRTSKVLLIAVPIQVRESYQKLFTEAGLNLEIIEIEALALIRSLVVGDNQNSIIVDIGSRSTGINIIRNGLLQLTRNISIGGDTITDRIAQSLNITSARAEQFKKDFDTSQSGFVPDTIQPVLASIKNEVRQLLTVYQTRNLTVDTLLLTGGSSNLPGTQEFFKDLGVKIQLGNPLRDILVPKAALPIVQRYKLQLPVAIGLALRKEKN